jgi:nicotinamide riboside transporter PnuC
MIDLDLYTVAVIGIQTTAALFAWRVAWAEGIRASRDGASHLRAAGWVLLATAYTGGLVLRSAAALDVPRGTPWLSAISLVNSCLFLAAAVLLSRYYTERARINRQAAETMRQQLADRGIVEYADIVGGDR